MFFFSNPEDFEILNIYKVLLQLPKILDFHFKLRKCQVKKIKKSDFFFNRTPCRFFYYLMTNM